MDDNKSESKSTPQRHATVDNVIAETRRPFIIGCDYATPMEKKYAEKQRLDAKDRPSESPSGDTTNKCFICLETFAGVGMPPRGVNCNYPAGSFCSPCWDRHTSRLVVEGEVGWNPFKDYYRDWQWNLVKKARLLSLVDDEDCPRLESGFVHVRPRKRPRKSVTFKQPLASSD